MVTELKQISYFPDKGWNINGLNYLLKKLRDTGSTDRQPGSGRYQSARTVENVDTVNDLVLSHKGALTFSGPMLGPLDPASELRLVFIVSC